MSAWIEGSATSTIVASRTTMKKAPQRSASAHQRRGSGVFSTSPPLRGADVISGLPLVSMRPPGCRFRGALVETPATTEMERQPLQACALLAYARPPADVDGTAFRLERRARLSIHRRVAGP